MIRTYILKGYVHAWFSNFILWRHHTAYQTKIEPLSFCVCGVRNTFIGFSSLTFEFSYVVLHNHPSLQNFAAYLAKFGETVADNHCYVFRKMQF
jgi:hypothetical protein